MKRKFLGIFLSMLLLLQIGIIPAYAVEIADDFTSYTTTADLANFEVTTGTNYSTSFSLATPADSRYDAALKIEEPANTTTRQWDIVKWKAIPSGGMSTHFQVNFSVYIDAKGPRRDFSVFSGKSSISFITFHSGGNIKRITDTKMTQSNADFDTPVEYKEDTWYDVEFRCNTVTGYYYVSVCEAGETTPIAQKTLTLDGHTLDDGETTIVDITNFGAVDSLGFRSCYDATNISSSVYIDNLSIKDITDGDSSDESGDDSSDKTFADDFSGYADTTALSSAFSNAGTSSGEENTVTQMSLETLSDSTYGNVLKITESSPEVQKWYYAKWNAVSGAELSGLIKASFSVNIDNETGFREFAILDGTKELSFISFRNGSIQRVDPDKTGEARVAFTNPATYEINTWYNVEFEYNLNTGEYYVAVRNAANNNSLIAEEKLTLISSKRPAIEAVDGFAFQSRRDDGEASGPAVYIDNLSIENISEPETEDFYVTPVTYTHINPANANKTITLTALKNAEITSWDVTSWVPVVAADGVTGINLKAYLALYKDGCLDKVKILPITTAGEHSVSFDEALTLAEGSKYMLRTYVWSGDTLIPMVTDAGISN